MHCHCPGQASFCPRLDLATRLSARLPRPLRRPYSAQARASACAATTPSLIGNYRKFSALGANNSEKHGVSHSPDCRSHDWSCHTLYLLPRTEGAALLVPSFAVGPCAAHTPHPRRPAAARRRRPLSRCPAVDRVALPRGGTTSFSALIDTDDCLYRLVVWGRPASHLSYRRHGLGTLSRPGSPQQALGRRFPPRHHLSIVALQRRQCRRRAAAPAAVPLRLASLLQKKKERRGGRPSAAAMHAHGWGATAAGTKRACIHGLPLAKLRMRC